MDKDAYPETLPQALKLLEKFKPESFADAATGEPAADSDVHLSSRTAMAQLALSVV